MKMGIRKGNKSGCHGRKAFAHGGRVKAYADGGMVGNEADDFMDDAADQSNMVDGVPVRQRLDRPAAKAPKSTNITINVGAPKTEVEAPKVPPVVPPGIPPMAGAPPMPPPMNVGGPPPGGLPMRKNGGRVGKMDGGRAKAMNDIGQSGISSDAREALAGAGASLAAIGARKAANAMGSKIRPNVAPSMGRKNGGRVGKMDGGSVRSEDEYFESNSRLGALPSRLKRAWQEKQADSSTQSEPAGTGEASHKRYDNSRIREGKPERVLPGRKSIRELAPMQGKSGTQSGTMRANGGRVDMDAGAGGGLGRLEKVKDYGKAAGKPAK